MKSAHFVSRPRARSSYMRLGLVTLAVVCLFAFDALSGGGLRGPARSLVASVSAAVDDADTRISGSGLLATRRSLATENRALREEVERLRAQAALSGALKAENERLQALARLSEHADGVSAPVVSSAGSSPYGTFLVGAGAGEGVRAGDLVFSDDGFAVGRVSDAQNDTSLVTELFAPGATFPVTLAHGTFTVEGQGGGNGRVRAPRWFSVGEGDVATAPSAGGAPVGVIGTVESDPASAYRTVYVRTPANLAALRFVYIRKL